MKKLGLFIVALMLSACADINDTRNAKGTGNIRAFAASKDKVFEAAKAAVVSNGLSVLRADKGIGEILASKGLSFVSYGENVAIFIRAKGATSEVEVVSKKVMATNILAPDWSNILLPEIEKNLK